MTTMPTMLMLDMNAVFVLPAKFFGLLVGREWQIFLIPVEGTMIHRVSHEILVEETPGVIPCRIPNPKAGGMYRIKQLGDVCRAEPCLGQEGGDISPEDFVGVSQVLGS
jgi:hypothetical protein